MLDTHRADIKSDHHFTPHVHEAHELLWGTTGMFTVSTAENTWVLTRAIGILIPVGTLHEGFAAKASSFYQTHFNPVRFAVPYARPVAVSVTAVLRELLIHLSSSELTGDARARMEQVAFELVQPVTVTSIELAMPRDTRARRVADGVIADPANRRSLAQWGRHVGASERTLTRLFAVETEMSFARWRIHARIGAAISLLTAGANVGEVARHVGYSSTSTFVRVFREATGETPGAYFSGHSTSALEFGNSVL